MSVTLLLVGSSDQELEAVLRSSGVLRSISTRELATLAEPSVNAPHVLVLDVRGESQLPASLQAYKRNHPATGVLIVADRLEPALLLEAMRAGVTEVVAAPIVRNEIQAAVARLLEQRPGIATAGKTFAFVGAKGGVGTTTVAVNVAVALGSLAPGSTLLIDLHVANGDTAVFLGTEPRFSIIDALENTHRLDEAFLRGLVVRTKGGVDLLASSDRVMVTPVDFRRIRTLIEFAERHYRYVVLDVPRSDAAVLESLDAASRIVVIANQELATVRSASRIAAALRQRYGKDKLSIVITRADEQANIGQEDIERAVGEKVKHIFPSDYRRALEALNKGRPITLDNHNELSNSLESFACSLAGLEKPKRQRPSSRFSLFGARKPSTAGAN